MTSVQRVGVRREYGEDKGASAHREHWARLVNAFRKLKDEIDRFNPDFILMFGDDQYENFTEDIIPPFCVLAYDDLISYPFKGRPSNVWGEPEDHPITMPSRPDIQCDSPESEPAKTHYQQALTLAQELGLRPLQAHCHRGLGALYRQIGQVEQARAELSVAIEMYRDMEMTFWLPETEAALAKLEGQA